MLAAAFLRPAHGKLNILFGRCRNSVGHADLSQQTRRNALSHEFIFHRDDGHATMNGLLWLWHRRSASVASGPCGVPRPSLAGSVTGTRPRRAAHLVPPCAPMNPSWWTASRTLDESVGPYDYYCQVIGCKDSQHGMRSRLSLSVRGHENDS